MIRNYDPQDAIELCGDENMRAAATLNQTAGPAYSLFVDGKLIACGGVRCYGVGEIWFLSNDENKKKYLKQIMRFCRSQLDESVRENHLWRLMAENTLSENFLKHFGFRESEKKLFTR